MAVHGDNHLPAFGVPPFLMAAFLADQDKTALAQDANHGWQVSLRIAQSFMAGYKAVVTFSVPSGTKE